MWLSDADWVDWARSSKGSISDLHKTKLIDTKNAKTLRERREHLDAVRSRA